MGVWANGGPSATSIDVQGIASAMRPALEMWMTGHIQIVDPNRQAGPGNQVVVLDSGADGALIQPLRTPNPIDHGGQPNYLMGIRFQVKQSAALTPGQELRGGLIVKVLDGGNSAQLAGLTYTLGEVVDSSIMWDYIFEAAVITGG